MIQYLEDEKISCNETREKIKEVEAEVCDLYAKIKKYKKQESTIEERWITEASK